MPDLNTLLNLGPYATNEQIQAAYNAKRAMLISLEASDPAAAGQLQQLDDAYAGHLTHNALALAPTAPPKPPPDPSLQMVGSLVNPIVIGAQAGEVVTCPNCGSQNPAQAAMCGACGQQIARPCPNCGKLMPLNSPVCPRCGTIARELDQHRLGDAMNTGNRVYTDRMDNDGRVQALEASHLARLSANIFVVVALVAALIGLCLFAAWSLGLFGGR